MSDEESLFISHDLYREVEACQEQAKRVAATVLREEASVQGSELAAGWSERRFDGQAFIASFSKLSLATGYTTRCFLFSWTGGSRCRIFMVPEGVRSEAVIGEPTLSAGAGAVRGALRAGRFWPPCRKDFARRSVARIQG